MEITYFLAIPVVVWGLVNFATVGTVRLMSRPDELLEEVDRIGIDSVKRLDEAMEFINWCLVNGFSHDKDFLFHGVQSGPPIKCSAWWSSTTRTWALLYILQAGKNVDFVTIYGRGLGVTTASSKDVMTLPKPPGSYIQAFTNMSNDERYALHKDALEGIEESLGAIEPEDHSELFQKLSESILRDVTFVKSKPLWQLRGAYWYFVNRNLRVNKRIRL